MKELEELGIPPQEAEVIKERVWRRIVRHIDHCARVASCGAWPAEEPHCEHGAGIGYCRQEDCEFS